MNLSEALWHKEDKDAILFGFTKEFIHEVLPEAWYVTPTKLDEEGEVKQGNPLLAIETNDELFSILSPFSGFHLMMNDKAIHFPDRIKIDTTVATLEKKKREPKQKVSVTNTYSIPMPLNFNVGGNLIQGNAGRPNTQPKWETIDRNTPLRLKRSFTHMVYNQRNSESSNACAFVWYTTRSLEDRDILKSAFQRIFNTNLLGGAISASTGNGQQGEFNRWLRLLQGDPTLTPTEREVFIHMDTE